MHNQSYFFLISISLLSTAHSPIHAVKKKTPQQKHALAIEHKENDSVITSHENQKKTAPLKDQESLLDATKNGKNEICDSLLTRNTNPNKKYENNNTYLHIAAQHGYTEITKALIHHNADINAYNIYGITPLCNAAENGHLETVRLLLSHKANPNIKCGNGDTALHKATNNNHTDIVCLLLNNKANVHARYQQHLTALHSAASQGLTTILDVLLKNNADVNTQNKQRSTALHAASFNGHTDAVKLLLLHRADPNLINEDASTALLLATEKEHIDIAGILLSHNANPNKKNKENITPLHYATEKNQTALVHLLLTHKANVDAQCKSGHTALHRAVHNKSNDEIINLLLSHNANPNTYNIKKMNSLHIAALREHTTVVPLLLQYQADINAQDKDHHTTALHYATYFGNAAMVMLLLEHQANVHICNKDNKTALQIATGKKLNDIIKILKQHNGDLLHCSSPLCTKQENLKICPLCTAAIYCSVECQKKHWPTHKLICKQNSSETVAQKPNHQTNPTQHRINSTPVTSPTQQNQTHPALNSLETFTQTQLAEQTRQKIERSTKLVGALREFDPKDKNKKNIKEENVWDILKKMLQGDYKLCGDDTKYQEQYDIAEARIFPEHTRSRHTHHKQTTHHSHEPRNAHRTALNTAQNSHRTKHHKTTASQQPTKPTPQQIVARQRPNQNLTSQPPLPPVKDMSEEERKLWHGLSSHPTPDMPNQLAESDTTPEADIESSADTIETAHRNYVQVCDIPGYGILLLDYTHLFEGEHDDNDENTNGGFHHDHKKIKLNKGYLQELASDFDGMRNGCYKCSYCVYERGLPKTKVISCFPSEWTQKNLLTRLKDALIGNTPTPINVYEDQQKDTCIVGQLPTMIGDRGHLSMGSLYTGTVYFKAIIKRHTPGVIRTVYPITENRYKKECPDTAPAPYQKPSKAPLALHATPFHHAFHQSHEQAQSALASLEMSRLALQNNQNAAHATPSSFNETHEPVSHRSPHSLPREVADRKEEEELLFDYEQRAPSSFDNAESTPDNESSAFDMNEKEKAFAVDNANEEQFDDNQRDRNHVEEALISYAIEQSTQDHLEETVHAHDTTSRTDE